MDLSKNIIPKIIRKIKIGYFNFLKETKIINKFLYNIDEFNIKIYLSPVDFSVSRQIFLKDYEFETTSAIKKILKKGDVVFDIGANIGYYTLIFAKLVGKTGAVHSFEPSIREFASLCENIKLNKYNNIFLNQVAVTNYDGFMKMAIFEDSTFGAYNTIGKPTHQIVESQVYKEEIIKSLSLDTYCKIYGSLTPQLIKVDIEGAELQLINGGTKLLSSPKSPILVIEICEKTLKGTRSSPQAVVEKLRYFGYDLFSIKRNGHLIYYEDGISLNLIAIKPEKLLELKQNGIF